MKHTLFNPLSVDLRATLALLALFAALPVAAVELRVGQAAPAFELPDQYEKSHHLEAYRGKWVVVYFYPKDETPGCTTEACNFRDEIYRIRALNTAVLGISLDSVESHARFAENHGLPFPLLSDADGEVATRYGCLTKFMGMTVAARHTFLVDPEGKLARIYRKVDPDTHAEEVIADLKALQGPG